MLPVLCPLLLPALLALSLQVGSNAQPAASERPNLVLFLADDLTYRDIACYGSPDAITPRIDQLAKEGMLFHKCYQAAAMCSPTRHNLFNGKYPMRTAHHIRSSSKRSEMLSIAASRSSRRKITIRLLRLRDLR